MPSRQVRLIYPPFLVDQPILYELIKKFGVTTNIRKADVNDGGGLLVMEMRAEDEVLDQALAWLQGLGITVEEEKR